MKKKRDVLSPIDEEGMGGHEVIVVDTHVILWDPLKLELLSRKAKAAIKHAHETDGILFCEISLWEIAMLVQ